LLLFPLKFSLGHIVAFAVFCYQFSGHIVQKTFLGSSGEELFM